MRVMTDLETVGQTPGCGILSIGAVTFSSTTGLLGEEFYVVVKSSSCLEVGLHEDQSTLDWWEKQSPEARTVLTYAGLENAEGTLHIREALLMFNAYLAQFNANTVTVWGNGADFDNAILVAAYRACRLEPCWKFWNNRCYRTLKGLYPADKLKRQGTYHNALDDAKSQAAHAIDLLRKFYAPQDELKRLKETLEELARLGNEPHLGNSDGNVIAQRALGLVP